MAASELNVELTLGPRSTVGHRRCRECDECIATGGAAHDDRHVAWFRAWAWQRGLRIGCQTEVHHAPLLGSQRPVHTAAFEPLEMFALAVTLTQQLDRPFERRVDPKVELACD